jgi:hypothetical protein
MILALRLFMTPLLIAATTLAGRRWGPGFSGWLIGFPLTSGPVSLILAMQYGPLFAARAAIGNLGGLASICAFCLAYCLIAPRWNWLVSAGAGVVLFLMATLVWNSFTMALLPTCAIALVAIGLLVRLIPLRPMAAAASGTPRWDIPLRMIIATAFVVTLTAFAAVLGPQLSGLITPFPVFAVVLAVFAHRQQGAQAAIQVLRGLGLSLFGCTAFFLVVGGLLPGLAIGWTYVLAPLATLAVNAISLRLGGSYSA